MDEIYLVTASEKYLDQVAEYRREFLEIGSSLDGCGSLMYMEDSREWLAQVEQLTDKKSCPENWVQSTQFLCIRKFDNRLVGMIQVRHYFNDFLEKFGGHIGYSVRPSERKKGYANRMLHDCLEFCKEIGLNKVLLTCLDTNDISRKVILKNGGVYESTVIEPTDNVKVERYWIEIEK